MIVAIDGPSGVGKSTAAIAVAARLDLPYVETGAMYRALGWSLLDQGVDPTDEEAVQRVAGSLVLNLNENPDGTVEILLDGEPLDSRIRTPGVSEITSVVSSYAGVRSKMVDLQRGFALRRGAVMEGRDIGTQVFPDTPYKFFLNASLAVRVGRRTRQLQDAGHQELSQAAIEVEVAHRDERDSTRKESPLTLDASYTVIDTTDLNADETVRKIIETILGPGGL